MIPRKIGALPDQRGFDIDRRIYIMPVNKTAGVSKVKLGSSTKKAAVLKKAAPKKTATLKKAMPATPSKKAVVVKKTTLVPASKKAVIKKVVGPKLTAPQHELLKKVVANKDAKGYHTAKKPEHRTLETLLKHKVVKKGPKHPETKLFHYQISTIGKKYLESGVAPKS
jgi:hypothetical protein